MGILSKGSVLESVVRELLAIMALEFVFRIVHLGLMLILVLEFVCKNVRRFLDCLSFIIGPVWKNVQWDTMLINKLDNVCKFANRTPKL